MRNILKIYIELSKRILYVILNKKDIIIEDKKYYLLYKR